MKNVHVVLHGTKWIIFNGILDIALGPSKWDGFSAKLGGMTSNSIAIDKKYYIICMWWNLDYPPFWIYYKSMLHSLNMIHFYFALSLGTHSLQNWNSISQSTALIVLQGPLFFYGHNLWSMCKATLNDNYIDYPN